MEHSLRVLVRIDTKSSTACVEVRGCLAAETCLDLFDILRNTASLGAHVTVNLSKAHHLDASALDELLVLADKIPSVPLGTGHTTVSIQLPARLPACGHAASPGQGPPLTNDQAFDMAFLQRDPKAFRRLS
ncbi:hypothetical protein [Arthrobacter caoxuetaonis]|uniref:hypothetical protein n=1 Tax=Arthrobacter caoxuetaonis TaxID=2886935 RepID=UPI001D15033A|nr:hypothetical protein [Arthrobacter caoxuetaonis]MCC3281641.1 hypothetical protein [Arthrobacter caoxuetaonis]